MTKAERLGHATPKSTGTLMAAIVAIAIELAFFQDLWWIVVIPPITMALLAINLAFGPC